MKKFYYHRPETLKRAYLIMEKNIGDARYIAGGTDLIVAIKNRVIEPDSLISLKGIKEISGISKSKGLSLGGMTLLRDIEREAFIWKKYPALAQAVKSLASPQTRNVATIGGNLCNAAPSADCAPPLLVMDAVLTLTGPHEQRKISVEDFFMGPGRTCMTPIEILANIHIPLLEENVRTSFLKISRTSSDIAIANAAASVTLENGVCTKCCLAVGAVAPTPLRLTSVEAIIEGEKISPELLDRAKKMVEDEVDPITDVRSTKEYRRIISGILIKRAIEQAVNGNKDYPNNVMS